MLLKPATPVFCGEPGVVVRAGMKAAVLTDLASKVACGLAVPAELAALAQAEYERTAKLLAQVQAAKAKLSIPTN